ncbi:MAG: NfeD family protein [Opitutaceae bacterium]
MSTILALFALGSLLIFFEIFLPGGILGVAGGLAILAGSAIAFMDYGSDGGTLAVVAGVALLICSLIIEFKFLPKTRLGRRLFLSKADSGASQPPIASDDVVGRECQAETTLAPSGVVVLDGKRYEAFSQGGYVERGSLLIVKGMDNFRLIVSKP